MSKSEMVTSRPNNPAPNDPAPKNSTAAAVLVLLVLTAVMLLALFSRTAPHPPIEVPLFALGPFLGASLAIGAAALYLLRHGARHGTSLAVLFALTALISFGPQKYLDPAFLRIWPAVISAQVAAVVIVAGAIFAWRRAR